MTAIKELIKCMNERKEKEGEDVLMSSTTGNCLVEELHKQGLPIDELEVKDFLGLTMMEDSEKGRNKKMVQMDDGSGTSFGSWRIPSSQ